METTQQQAAKMETRELHIFFGRHEALKGVSVGVASREILGVIGPAGSGKTTFLRALNRMNELTRGSHMEGQVLMDGEDVYHPEFDPVSLRKRVGMVFALPVPLPMSIRDNLVYGPRLSGVRDRKRLDELVEKSLRAAFMWDEVKDRLGMPGLRLSGGQQQRLCLARVLAMQPEVILLDEPCSGLDPISTAKIEEALQVLKSTYSIVLVTNNTKQAARVADRTAFFLMGHMVEIGLTEKIFTVPEDKRTNDYVTGRFG
jgi:phosphate transport system ATP-binding protein